MQRKVGFYKELLLNELCVCNIFSLFVRYAFRFENGIKRGGRRKHFKLVARFKPVSHFHNSRAVFVIENVSHEFIRAFALTVVEILRAVVFSEQIRRGKLSVRGLFKLRFIKRIKLISLAFFIKRVYRPPVSVDNRREIILGLHSALYLERTNARCKICTSRRE